MLQTTTQAKHLAPLYPTPLALHLIQMDVFLAQSRPAEADSVQTLELIARPVGRSYEWVYARTFATQEDARSTLAAIEDIEPLLQSFRQSDKWLRRPKTSPTNPQTHLHTK